MKTSRIGVGKQAIIPEDVWIALGLEPGDELAWTIADGYVRVTRADADEFSPEDMEYIKTAVAAGRASGQGSRTFDEIVRDVLGEDG